MTETPNPNIVDTDALTGEQHPISQAVLSLGSNLGERFNSLQGALNSLADTPGVYVVSVSPVYETVPVDAPEGSRDYLNAVVLIDTTLSPGTLLERAQAIEDAFGRERDAGEVNAPRTLDVDVIVVGEHTTDSEELTLPHPRAHERAFVLQPWADIDPDAEIPGRGRVSDLLAKVGSSGVNRREDLDLEA